MKKGYWIAIVLILLIIGGIIFWFVNNNNSNKSIGENSNYDTQKSSTTENVPDNSDVNNVPENAVHVTENATSEEELAVFSTKIYTKDSSRQNNVSITCSSLNGTEVQPGATFSFCDTLGRSTPEKGYQEAEIFNGDGEKVKGYGGGKCQVSTTLYNAVLAVPELQVTERHEHSNSVPYIQNGKDAAVAYGSYDLKFVNNLNSTIKIVAENTPDTITIKLVKIDI